MVGLFLKMEQNNLYNEINFNLYATTMPDNATAIRRTIDGFVCPSNRRPTTVATADRLDRDLPARAVRLPRQHGRRHDHPDQRANLLPTLDPTNPLLLHLRQRHHVSELHGQHGRHHRRNFHHDHLRREHLPQRRLVAGDELPSFGPTSTGPSTADSSTTA